MLVAQAIDPSTSMEAVGLVGDKKGKKVSLAATGLGGRVQGSKSKRVSMKGPVERVARVCQNGPCPAELGVLQQDPWEPGSPPGSNGGGGVEGLLPPVRGSQ